jgi:hypothetical protein
VPFLGSSRLFIMNSVLDGFLVEESNPDRGDYVSSKMEIACGSSETKLLLN